MTHLQGGRRGGGRSSGGSHESCGGRGAAMSHAGQGGSHESWGAGGEAEGQVGASLPPTITHTSFGCETHTHTHTHTHTQAPHAPVMHHAPQMNLALCKAQPPRLSARHTHLTCTGSSAARWPRSEHLSAICSASMRSSSSTGFNSSSSISGRGRGREKGLWRRLWRGVWGVGGYRWQGGWG